MAELEATGSGAPTTAPATPSDASRDRDAAASIADRSDRGDAPTSPPATDEALLEAVWARVQMARNVQRPHTLELLALMADDVVELHGDAIQRAQRRSDLEQLQDDRLIGSEQLSGCDEKRQLVSDLACGARDCDANGRLALLLHG